jgi:phosphoenolpyruvate-protein kinase (PTS system EI component)
LGVDELSMTKVAIPEVKDVLRRLTRKACRDAVDEAIAKAEDAAESRPILEGRLDTSLASQSL